MSAQTLLDVLAPMPDDATVPVRWVREHLAEDARRTPADYTIEQAAAIMGWSPSTLRNYMPELRRFGAYKLGRRWRIPESALREWQGWRSTVDAPNVDAQRKPESTDLSAWRKERSR